MAFNVMLSRESENLLPEMGYKPEQILKGAMQVFLKHGYAGTSMDRVAAEAGVSKHTIYNHFQGKEGLFIALFERLVIRHFDNEFVGCELPLGEPPEAVLRRLAGIVLARMDDPEYVSFIRLLIAESGRFPELAQLYLREVVYKGDEILGAYLKNHPQLNLPDPDMTAKVFLGSLVTFMLTQEVLHGKSMVPIAKERFVDTLIALVWGDRPA